MTNPTPSRVLELPGPPLLSSDERPQLRRYHLHERVNGGSRRRLHDVDDAVLGVRQDDEIARLDRGGKVRDTEVVAVHVVNANENAEHARIVPRA